MHGRGMLRAGVVSFSATPPPTRLMLNLDFNRYIDVHASATPQTKADVWKSVGK